MSVLILAVISIVAIVIAAVALNQSQDDQADVNVSNTCANIMNILA